MPGKKVLVIDDEVRLRKNLAEMLTLRDYTVYEAADGVEGLKMAGKVIPDIILCDIMMPNSDGYDFITKLQSTEQANIPVIFITAKTDRDDERKGMNLGAGDFIRKPFSIDEIISSIEINLLKKSRFNDEVRNYNDNSTYEFARLVNGHEIRTHVNIILGMTSLLNQLNFDVKEKEGALKMLNRVELSGWQVLNTINHLYYFELTKLPTEEFKDKFDLSDVYNVSQRIKHLISRLGKLYDRESDIEHYLIGGNLSLPIMMYDYIIEELLSNSLKFTDKNTAITLSIISSENNLRIEVLDKGFGFAIKSIDDIKPFTRFNTNENIAGLGLGLYNIKKLIEMVNGSMQVSVANNECKITLEIPNNYENE